MALAYTDTWTGGKRDIIERRPLPGHQLSISQCGKANTHPMQEDLIWTSSVVSVGKLHCHTVLIAVVGLIEK